MTLIVAVVIRRSLEGVPVLGSLGQDHVKVESHNMYFDG